MLPIGAQLRRLREEKRISLGAMARKSGVQPYFIRRVEKGRFCPSLETLE
jgi:transcriptional regulator with XRE-family HTH domain